MMGSWRHAFWGLFLVVFSIVPAWSKPLTQEEVPDPLKPWVSWSLYGQEEAVCPPSFNASGDHWCLWPGELDLEVGPRGGKFTQTWELFAPGRVLLPAGERHWPQEVRVNGKPAVVTFQSTGPSVLLTAGKHRLEGLFIWDNLPETLVIPPSAGLVRLSIEGKEETPRIEKDGRLWLRGKRAGEAALEDKLQIQVFRKLTDDIPVVLTTRLVLDVSGRSREVLLGKALPADFIPASLQSALPIRIEPDGRLRVQIRPGRWVLEIVARHQGSLTHLSMGPSSEQWPAEEIWSFETRPHLRLVALEGLTPIDPKLTNLPSQWASFPAFIAHPGETLTVKEKRRGDPDPAPDQLSLQRTLWLDFDGGGFTMQDRISGSMTRGWRLELLPPADLGRVSIDGVDRFITRTTDGSGAGVEVRRGQLEMVADSRLESSAREIPATGWNQDFVSVQATLNLPPGWRLLHAVGADSIPGTWITQWSLFDLFVVLLISLAAGKLWGWSWGVLALLSLGLSYHEPGAPRWVWLHLLAAVALVRVLPSGRARTFAGLYRNFSLVALLIFFLPFAVTQIRSGIYPQLELRYGGFDQQRSGLPAAVSMRTKRPEMLLETMDRTASKEAASLPYPAAPINKKSDKRLLLHESNAKVQTGPGLPQWQWRSVPVRWNGPVKVSQSLKLVFLSPGMNLLLAFIRVLLLGLLVWLFLDLRKEGEGKWNLAPRAGWLPFLVAGLVSWSAPAQADIPGPEILDQLQKRLLAPADCFPHCAEIQTLDVGFSPDRLTLDMVIHAEAHVAVPLPGERNQWIPDRVRLDGQPAPLYLDSDGRTWIPVPSGRHQVSIAGLMPNRESVVLPLPLPPRRFTASGQGWEIEGLDGTWPPQQLQFRRLAEAGEKRLATLEPSTLPSFFRVERTLALGIRWTVSTKVTRLFAGGSPTVITVPLLPGEAVTSEGVPAANGQVTLNIPAGVNQLGWESVLDVAPSLILKAASGEQWSESWKLDVSPIWHVEWQGIPVVHHQDPGGNWLPEWRPWPGEGIELVISRPEGVAGRTLTIDDSLLTVKPGNRATQGRLQFHLRSSQGGQHVLTLPDQAELQEISIDGRSQPIRQEGRLVTIPLAPGEKEVDLAWMIPQGAGSVLHTPAVNLGTPSVNARIRLEMPRDRWILFAGGPRLGPAVLFWGVLLVLIPIAFGLARSSLTPLKFHHWLLLGIGLTQLQPVNALLVVCWLLALGVRGRVTLDDRDWAFNLMQIGLAIVTGLALLSLLVSVQQGLLGYPHMQISGNGSSAGQLVWYQDRAVDILPQAWVLSVPMMVYRLLMLGWALWLAMSLLRWLQWGWKAFSRGGLWRPVKVRRMLKEKDKQ